MRLDRLLQHLQLRVGPRRHVVAERIDAFGRARAWYFFMRSATPGKSIFGTGSQKS